MPTWPRHRRTPPFLRFLVVGSIGFAVDAGVLQLLLLQDVGPLLARAASFPVAALVTVQLNHAWTFSPEGADLRARGGPGAGRMGAYAMVQLGGAICNLGTYMAALAVVPPALAVAAGSIAAIALTFPGARFVLTRSRCSA